MNRLYFSLRRNCRRTIGPARPALSRRPARRLQQQLRARAGPQREHLQHVGALDALAILDHDDSGVEAADEFGNQRGSPGMQPLALVTTTVRVALFSHMFLAANTRPTRKRASPDSRSPGERTAGSDRHRSAFRAAASGGAAAAASWATAAEPGYDPNWLLSASSKQLLDVLGALGLLEEPAERVVAELPRDVLQGPEVIARPIGRRNQQEKQLDLLAVEAGEIDPLAADGHRAHQPVDAGMLGVRHGHAAADAGAAQFLALEDRLDDALELVGLDFSRLEQRLDHLANGPFFIRRRPDRRESPHDS